MIKNFPITPVIILAGTAALILTQLIYRQDLMTKDKVLLEYENISAFYENESDFDKIIAYIEHPEREQFLQIFLERMALDDIQYSEKFESRYPRFHEYKQMERELKRNEFSQWIASVINGDIITEYENDVFSYLRDLKENWYIDQAISRFFKIAHNLKKNYNDYENHLATIIYLYIEQFPKNTGFNLEMTKNKELIQSLGNIDINVSDSKLFYYLSLKNFGVEEFINQRLSTLEGTGIMLDGEQVLDQEDVNFLINDFIKNGSNVPEYFYPLFQIAINKRSPTYLYIAMRVFKDIGYNDETLVRWLNRDYSTYKLIIYSGGTSAEINAAIRADREEEERKIREEERKIIRGYFDEYRGYGYSLSEISRMLREAGYTGGLIQEEESRKRSKEQFPNVPVLDDYDFSRYRISPDFNLNRYGTSLVRRETIDFPNEARIVKESIQNKSRPEYSALLKRNSARSASIFNSPPATILGEIKEEFSDYYEINKKYTNSDIIKYYDEFDIKKANLKTLALIIFLITLIPAIIISILSNARVINEKYLLTWVPLLLAGHLVLFLSMKKTINTLDISAPITIYIIMAALLAFFLIKPFKKLSTILYDAVSKL